MRNLVKFAIGLGLTVSSLSAGYIDTYYAKLADIDHYNSRGVRLHSVAAIIRQDRFNYHIRGIRQRADTWDPLFARKVNRARLESMIRNGSISWSARQSILYGNPVIKVDIYDNKVNVRVIRGGRSSGGGSWVR